MAKVLVVDDDRSISELLQVLVTKAGHTPLVARDGKAGLELAQLEKPDLIVLDVMMPKMDGFEAMRRIRKHQDQRVRELPIVALTAKAMKEDHEKCMEAGASDYLPKPVNLENLTTVMKIWLPVKGFLS